MKLTTPEMIDFNSMRIKLDKDILTTVTTLINLIEKEIGSNLVVYENSISVSIYIMSYFEYYLKVVYHKEKLIEILQGNYLGVGWKDVDVKIQVCPLLQNPCTLTITLFRDKKEED